MYIDSIGISHIIYNYRIAEFNACVGDETLALKVKPSFLLKLRLEPLM